jgi:RNA polymerase sigma-70 factor (ECF subfamily)
MDLLQRFALGDIDAFETLARKHQGEIYGWIVSIVRDRGIAEDLTVETLWRIYQARHRFRTDGNFPAWARRIATNLAIDHLRVRHPEDPLISEPSSGAPADHLLEREARDQVREAFRRLPAKLQVAATLALVEEKPYEEIADALGTTTGAVKTRVFRAVRILRKQLTRLGLGPASTK